MKKMIKNFLLCTSAVLVSDYALANAPAPVLVPVVKQGVPTTSPCRSPFYIGAKAGIAALSGKYSAFNPLAGDLHFARAGGTSGQFGLLIGAGTFITSNLYTALELDGFYDSYNNNVRISSSTTGVHNHIAGIKANFRFGFSGRVGVQLYNGVMPFVMVGGELGSWTMRLANESTTSNRGIAANSSTSYKKTQVSPKIGGGIHFPICGALSGRLEYNYLFGPTIKRSLVDSVTGINWKHKASTNQHSVNIAFIYNFG